MKTIEEILKQSPVYLNDWEETKRQGLIDEFKETSITRSTFNDDVNKYPDNWEEINILFASYGTENYQGEAFVLFEKEGKLFEVNGNHCSCYGLGGQWEPEETTLQDIEYRLVKGTMGRDGSEDFGSGNEFAIELKQFLGIL